MPNVAYRCWEWKSFGVDRIEKVGIESDEITGYDLKHKLIQEFHQDLPVHQLKLFDSITRQEILDDTSVRQGTLVFGQLMCSELKFAEQDVIFYEIVGQRNTINEVSISTKISEITAYDLYRKISKDSLNEYARFGWKIYDFCDSSKRYGDQDMVSKGAVVVVWPKRLIIPKQVQVGLSPTYKVLERVGKGGYGSVCAGERTDDFVDGPKKIALKFEEAIGNRPPPFEWEVYKNLCGINGIPRVYFKGRFCDHYVMVMDMLGPSLLDFMRSKNIKMMSAQMVAQIAVEAISILESVHKKGYVHCDIKPANMLFGSSGEDTKVYIADLGLATRWRKEENGEHVWCDANAGFRGTTMYASINALRGVTLSRRDDLEQLAYTLSYLLHGTLPWEDNCLTSSTLAAKEIVCEHETLCSTCHIAINNFVSSIKRLGFDEEPQYASYISLFKDMVRDAVKESGNKKARIEYHK